MAGDATRRVIRHLLVLLLASLTGLACAAFGNASYTRLSPDRVVIFAGQDRFVLERDAAWVLSDEKKADRFKKWREKADLPADLSALVATLPKDRQIPFLGEVAVQNTGADKVVTFTLSGAEPKPIRLVAVQGGWRPNDEGKAVFAQIAKGFKMSPSTLSLDLADTGGDVSEAKAWAKFLDRFAVPEFFVVIGARKGVLWAHGAEASAPATGTTTTTTGGGTADPAPKNDSPPSNAKVDPGIPVWIWFALGVSALGNVVLLMLGLKMRRVEKTDFTVTHHERQLVEKVRDEQKRLDVDSRSMAGAEELVVGKMIEAYDQYDKVNNERLELLKFRQFKEDFETFDKQAKQIKQQSDERQKAVQELTAQLKREQSGQASLQKELTEAKNTIASLQADLAAAEKLLDDLGLWQKDFGTRLEQMAGQMRHE